MPTAQAGRSVLCARAQSTNAHGHDDGGFSTYQRDACGWWGVADCVRRAREAAAPRNRSPVSAGLVWPPRSSMPAPLRGGTSRAWSTSAPIAASSPCSQPALSACTDLRVRAAARAIRRLARIAAGQEGIQAFRAAIGPEAAPARLHVMEPDDCSSLLAPTERQSALFPQTRLAGSLPVEMAPLHAFIGPGDLHAPALLKLDVQGFELAALAGCAALLDPVRSDLCRVLVRAPVRRAAARGRGARVPARPGLPSERRL